MALVTEFTEIALEDLHREAALKKVEGWRFMQTHAVSTDDGVDLYYSFMKEGAVENLKVKGLSPENPVPSITDLFLAAFVFENEARELFGVDMRDIAIDFGGAMYAPAVSDPMTIMTPEQKAAREKARKAAAAKAAKEAAKDGAADGTADASAAGAAGASAAGTKVFVMTPERRARLDAKLATMSPEKVAKVEAALAAREAEAKAAAAAPTPGAADRAASTDQAAESPKAEAKPDVPAVSAAEADTPVAEAPADEQLDAKIALLDEDKAKRVRAALAARRGEASAEGEAAPAAAEMAQPAMDDELAAKIAAMDSGKAAKVRAALAAKAAAAADAEGGN